MIYITGDCHGDFTRLNTRNFPEQKQLTKDDYIIICGDFGAVCSNDPDNKEENHILDWLDDKNFTTLFIDGNHENHRRLLGMKVETWHGGKAHKIRDSVIHLMRGQVYDIDGKKFFTLGGASSHDISDGILDIEDPDWRKKAKRNIILGKRLFRVKGFDWWEEELPSYDELKEALSNLYEHDFSVDYIITHCGPTRIQNAFAVKGSGYESDRLTELLDSFIDAVEYKHWYFGHYHVNLDIDDRHTIIYKNMIKLEE